MTQAQCRCVRTGRVGSDCNGYDSNENDAGGEEMGNGPFNERKKKQSISQLRSQV
jgi:hypothetical protein